jgi:chemotaxis response regulator CheB
VVDDLEDMRTLIRLTIRAADSGLVVVGEAASGHEALERVDELDPDVIALPTSRCPVWGALRRPDGSSNAAPSSASCCSPPT